MVQSTCDNSRLEAYINDFQYFLSFSFLFLSCSLIRSRLW